MRISFYDQYRITTDSLLQMILSIAASIGADPLEMNALRFGSEPILYFPFLSRTQLNHVELFPIKNRKTLAFGLVVF